MKIGRNDICPCGSGKKFKKCHLGVAPNILIPRPIVPLPKLPPDLLRRAREAFEKQRTNETKRIETFGKIRPIMHAAAFGDHIVSVGARLYRMPQRSTFTNFLLTYGLSMLGDEWCETQSHLSDEEQHPLAALHCRANEFMSRQPVQPEGYVTVVPNGPLAFCKRFYYDLYIVDNNNELRDDLLHRLRHKEHFQAAAHELFVEASCLRAGFSIIPESFTGPKPKNVEFIAVHKATQQHLSIEAKSRHRSGVLGRPGAPDPDPSTRFGSLINDAVGKDAGNPLAIFVDTNLPPEKVDSFYKPVSLDPMVMSGKMQRLVKLVRGPQEFDLYNLLIFTNHPQHYGDDEHRAPQDQWGAFTPTNPRVKVFHPKALNDLLEALDLYGNIPTDFPKLLPGTNRPA